MPPCVKTIIPRSHERGIAFYSPIHEVVPNAVRIADIIDASICNDHFTISFFDIMQFTIYEFTI